LELDPKDRGNATQFGDWKNSPFIRARVPEKEREKIDGGYPVEEK
jgi:hypothetical protein